MPASTMRPESVYRRRVLGVGGVAALALFAIGAPIVNHRIETDLERRVSAELAGAGVPGVTVRFSGQDGSLTCTTPLADPERALDVAYGVRGVRRVELARACRVATAPGGPVGSVPDSTPVTPPASGPDTSDPLPSVTAPVYATVAEAVAGDAMFSSLARLFEGSPTGLVLAQPDGGPVTLLAPTDAAFDALSADDDSALASDADLRERVLRDHVIQEVLSADDLRQRAGTSLTTLDGRQLEVVVDGDTISVGGAPVTGDPIETDLGPVYPLGAVLLPDGAAGVRIGAPIKAALAAGQITLTGRVATDADRAALATAAQAAVGAGNVIDELTVDGGAGTDPGTVTAVTALMAALDTELVDGSAGFDGTRLYLSGHYADEAAAAAAAAAADAVGATTALLARPVLQADSASALGVELNELVTAQPIRFEPGSAVIDASSATTLDRLAGRLREYTGVIATIVGHTDSDGRPADNQRLSEARAASVRQALVDRGVDPDSLTSSGLGSTQPVLVNGIEDKSASRRVEFRIAAA